MAFSRTAPPNRWLLNLIPPQLAPPLPQLLWPAASMPAKDKLEVVFHRDYRMDDGRFNNNGWMQELPDPITKMTWENVILMSVKTAQELGRLSFVNHGKQPNQVALGQN